jgi:uncharacterized membrane protein
MKTNRLEAFSDGVLAIIITIMVMQLRAPKEMTWEALVPILPVFVSYILSFIYIGIYWNNHHHLFQITKRVNGKILWANMHLLFWLSLIPFATSWIGENHLMVVPVVYYGIILFMSGVAYFILHRLILKLHKDDEAMQKAYTNQNKAFISMGLYLLGIALCFVNPILGAVCYLIVAIMWIIPNKQVEKHIE